MFRLGITAFGFLLQFQCFLLRSLFTHPGKKGQIQWHLFTHPGRSLRVIPFLVIGVGMHENTQRTAVDDQPRNERAELSGGEHVDLEHGQRMRTDGTIPDLVNPQFREFPPDAFPQRRGKLALFRIVLPCVSRFML